MRPFYPDMSYFLKRPIEKRDTSMACGWSVARSAAILPNSIVNLKPCPEQGDATTTWGARGNVSITKCSSSVLVNKQTRKAYGAGWAEDEYVGYGFDYPATKVRIAQLDEALAGILQLRDTPGTSNIDPQAHGSGFDRVGAFQDGYDNGPEKCKGYRDDDPVVVELPFNDEEDAARGGDAPYDSIINGVPYDLEDYWTHVYPELTNGEPWVPVKGLEPFDASKPPMCGGSPAEGYVLFYCVPDDYIGWDNTETMPEVYRQGGDFAVATLLATQYGLAAMTRANDQSDEKVQSLRGDCFAGAYTASVLLQNRKETSSFQVSPGDLDEAITALLVFRGDGDVERQGAGFERIRHYRNGVIEGAKACLKD